MGLRAQLSGKTILLTGVTGFVGEALLERFLTDLPGTRVAVLVRPQGDTNGTARARELLDRPAFGRLREHLGGDVAQLDALFAGRVTVLDGGLDDPPPLPRDLDIVIHCAGDVSFDPPIDGAVETNLLGTIRLLDAVLATGSHPHFVHVSTAYVAGMRRGAAPEGPLTLQADWRTEAASAHQLRVEAEARSRTPDVLRRLRHEAETEHRRSAYVDVRADIERRRRDWLTASSSTPAANAPGRSVSPTSTPCRRHSPRAQWKKARPDCR